MALVRWDRPPGAGTVIAYGAGRRAVWRLELAPAGTADIELRLRWGTGTTLAGASGAIFQDPGGWVVLAATRRWLRSAEVLLELYVNDLHLGTVRETRGAIEPVSGALFTLGCYAEGSGDFAGFFTGDIGGAFVMPRVLSHEELRQLYRRIAVHQLTAGELVRAHLPVGEVYAADPESRIQRELALEGDALGWALSLAEELREDALPDRAWSTLDRWEAVTALAPLGTDSIETRRSRVVGFLRAVQGYGVDRVPVALSGLLAAPPEALEILEYDSRFDVDLSYPVLPLNLQVDTPAGATFEPTAGEHRATAPAGAWLRWETGEALVTRQSIDADYLRDAEPSVGVRVATELRTAALPAGALAGVFLSEFASKRAVWFGLYQPTESAVRLAFAVYSGGSWQIDPNVWNRTPELPLRLRLHHVNGDDLALHFSRTREDDLSGRVVLRAPPAFRPDKVGIGVLSFGPLPAGLRAGFSSYRSFFPRGLAPFSWYVFRDPALPGAK